MAISDIELSYDLACVRTLRSVNAKPYCGIDALAHWCEWDHHYEGARTLSAQIQDFEQCHWRKFVRPGSIVIDIGAHSGDTAVPLALFAYDATNQKRGTVIAVEPNPKVFQVLNINLALNSHIADFVPVQAAITSSNLDEVEISDLGTANCNTGIVSIEFSQALQNRLNEVTLNTYKARGLTLAQLIRENILPSAVGDISFIKIDCEGYDKEIINSSADIISALRPTLFVEWFAMFSPGESADLFKAIDAIGYVPLDPRTLHPASLEHWVTDIIAVPKELSA